MRFIRRDPQLGYVDTMLYVPKGMVNVEGVKNALTFCLTDKRGTTRYLELWEETENHIIVPRALWNPKDLGFEAVDCRPTSFPSADIVSDICLDYKNPTASTQQDAARAIIESNGGILQLRCGGGKSVIALHVAAQLATPTLIIVDNNNLMSQWRAEVERHLRLTDSIGQIQGDIFDWKRPIVLSTYQTLANKAATLSEEVRRWFGLIIWDECFVPGTLVDGLPIETRKVGDSIRTFDHVANKEKIETITHVFASRPRALVRIHLLDGCTLVCTPNHPIYTKGGYKPADDLQKHDAVAKLQHYNKEGGKDCALNWVGVEGIEVLQPGSDGTYKGLCPKGLVYNLEVTGTHNYFAEGVLVHNCHHSSAPIFCRSVSLFYGLRLGLTATPERTDGTQIVYTSHIGKVLYKNLRQELTPRFEFIWTGLGLDMQNPETRQAIVDRNGEIHLSKLASYLGRWRERLDKIIALVREHEAAGRKTMVLSNTVGELVNLLALYNGQETLYTDIPAPRAEEFDSDLAPVAVHKIARARMEVELKRAKLALFDKTLNSMRKEQIKKKLIPHIESRIQQHELAKNIERMHEKKQRDYVKNLIQTPSTAGLMIARVPTATRMHMLKTKKTIFTIYRYGLEGLDDAELDTIIAAEPMTAKNALQQFVGRILRKRAREKFPLVQFLEDNIGPYIGMCKVVRRVLRAWPTDEGGPYKYELIGHPYLKEGRPWKAPNTRATGYSLFPEAESILETL